jgi:hypothetical protein
MRRVVVEGAEMMRDAAVEFPCSSRGTDEFPSWI